MPDRENQLFEVDSDTGHQPSCVDEDILEALEARGLNTANMRLDENGLLHIPIKETFPDIPELSCGYAFKGGTARWILEHTIGLQGNLPPRDFDIIRLTFIEPDDSLDQGLAQRYMPDDYQHGYGVQRVDEEQSYFSSHDFTINELYATREEIVATPACIEDTLDRILQFTAYKQETSCDKLCAKALRFKVESKYAGNGHITFSNDVEAALNYSIAPFYIALHLDRAWDRGKEVAQDYVDTLKGYSQLPDSVNTPEEAVAYLSKRVHNFAYRNATMEHNGSDPMESLEKRAKIIDSAYEKYEKQDIAERKTPTRFKKTPKRNEPKAPYANKRSWTEAATAKRTGTLDKHRREKPQKADGQNYEAINEKYGRMLEEEQASKWAKYLDSRQSPKDSPSTFPNR